MERANRVHGKRLAYTVPARQLPAHLLRISLQGDGSTRMDRRTGPDQHRRHHHGAHRRQLLPSGQSSEHRGQEPLARRQRNCHPQPGAAGSPRHPHTDQQSHGQPLGQVDRARRQRLHHNGVQRAVPEGLRNGLGGPPPPEHRNEHPHRQSGRRDLLPNTGQRRQPGRDQRLVGAPSHGQHPDTATTHRVHSRGVSRGHRRRSCPVHP